MKRNIFFVAILFLARATYILFKVINTAVPVVGGLCDQDI